MLEHNLQAHSPSEICAGFFGDDFYDSPHRRKAVRCMSLCSTNYLGQHRQATPRSVQTEASASSWISSTSHTKAASVRIGWE